MCSIQLLGDTTFNLTQSKVAIPKELMVAKTAKELFSFLALQIEKFLKTHHSDHFEAHTRRRATVSTPEGYRDEAIFKLGFTFSFPVHQTGIASGNLIRWTKGFDIQDAVGKDVCKLLQDEIDALHLPVTVAALVNDTVGTLMARAYTSPGETSSLLGAIFGTGTNGAYVEKVSNITKKIEGEFDTSSGEMVINTEWGSFDNSLKVLKLTTYDKELDAGSVNPGIQMFEKLISGMFLGEILRVVIVDLHKEFGLLKHDNSSQNDLKSSTFVYEDSPLHTPWGVDSSILSIAAADESVGLRALRQEIKRLFGVSGASLEDAEAIKVVAAAIAKRAARLAGSAVAGIVLQSGRLTTSSNPAPASKIVDDVKAGNLQAAVETAASKVVDTATVPESEIVDIGVDGSLVEFYPNFEDLMREALRAVDSIGAAGERRIRIGIAKDGSGVGAALIALVADKSKSSIMLDMLLDHANKSAVDKKDNLSNLRSKLGNVELAQDGSAQR